MNKLGDVVFCVDCDRERQAHLEIAGAGQEPDAIPTNSSAPEPDSQSPEHDEHPRRMATKKDANGDPLCSQCLDDRQAKRRAEFMLSDDRRTVVHWPRRGRASDPKPVLMSALAPQATTATTASTASTVSMDAVANRSAGSRVGAAALKAAAAGALTAPANGARSKRVKLPARLPTALPSKQPKQDPSKSKAAFVRSLPPGMSAKQVIAQARKHGLAITPAYVYVIRSNDGSRRQHGGHNTGHHNGALQAAREIRAKSNGEHGPVPTRVPERALDIRSLRIPKPKDRGIERKFMWLAVELGFLRTEQLLDELRTKIRVVFTH